MIIRNLRKRWVLASIFVTSLIYFLYNVFQQGQQFGISQSKLQEAAENRVKVEELIKNLRWNVETNSSKETEIANCRNSLQGKELIADELGYICPRAEVEYNGCCSNLDKNTERYICSSCSNSNCCSIYEHCVSCCMQPNKKILLSKIIREASNSLNQKLYSSVEDQFELCLSKCRTSSSSVQHENTYRDEKTKYCFGRNVPGLRLV